MANLLDKLQIKIHSLRGRVVKLADEEGDGVWRTVNGRKVFIRKGEDLSSALDRSLGSKKSQGNTGDKAGALDLRDKLESRLRSRFSSGLVSVEKEGKDSVVTVKLKNPNSGLQAIGAQSISGVLKGGTGGKKLQAISDKMVGGDRVLKWRLY